MRLNNVATSAATAAAVGVAGATRAMTVTGSVDFALNDDPVFTVMARDEQGQN
jgi:hypothetical protein